MEILASSIHQAYFSDIYTFLWKFRGILAVTLSQCCNQHDYYYNKYSSGTNDTHDKTFVLALESSHPCLNNAVVLAFFERESSVFRKLHSSNATNTYNVHLVWGLGTQRNLGSSNLAFCLFTLYGHLFFFGSDFWFRIHRSAISK